MGFHCRHKYPRARRTLLRNPRLAQAVFRCAESLRTRKYLLKALILCKYTIPSCGRRFRRADGRSRLDGTPLKPSPGAPYRAPGSPFHGSRSAEYHPAVSTTHSEYASEINACTGLQAGTLLHSLLGFKSPLPTLHAPLGPKLASTEA